jgi:hypothetical protein
MYMVGNGMEILYLDLEYSDEKPSEQQLATLGVAAEAAIKHREAWVVGETRREYKKQQRGGRKLAGAVPMRKSKRN